MIRSQEKGFTISNSDSKCLLENWVEERNSMGFDTGFTEKELLRQGHHGLLSTDQNPLSNKTTYLHDYIPLDSNVERRKYGRSCRKDMLNDMFTKRAIEQLQLEKEQEIARQMEEKIQSETAAKFWKEQQMKLPSNLSDHSLNEPPITFWTEHHKRITGNTKIPPLPESSMNGLIDSTFRKNTHFSKPIDERFDDWCDTV